jgi:hypothetical protein
VRQGNKSSSPGACADPDALAQNDRVRINVAFEAMRDNPFGGDIKFLKGMGVPTEAP